MMVFLRAGLRWQLMAVLLILSMPLMASADFLSLLGSSSGNTQARGYFGSGAGFSYFDVSGQKVGTFAWHPNYKFGPWATGLDINILMANQRPEGFQDVILRYAEYDDGMKGLRYGVLENVTYGWGLLMKNYSTVAGGPVQLTNKQVGLKGYAYWGTNSIGAMGTWSNVYALRLTQKPLASIPWLVTGQTIVADTDPAVSGWGLDASIPLGVGGDVFTELSGLSNNSTGFSAGYKWGLDLFIANIGLTAAYRTLGKGFIPGFFGQDYETNPVNLTSAEAFGGSSGYLLELKASAMQIASLSLLYETYGGSNSINANASAAIEKITATGYYRNPNFTDFRPASIDTGALMGAMIGYKVSQGITLVTNYKRSWNPTQGQLVTTKTVEIRFDF